MKYRNFSNTYLMLILCAVALLFTGQVEGVDNSDPKNSISAHSKASEKMPMGLMAAVANSLGRDHLSYHIENKSGYVAEVSSQGLSTEFNSSNITIKIDDQKLMNMRLESWGRTGELESADEARISTKANRLEYDRAGISEWYVNSPYGLEQGFTIHERPEGGGTILVNIDVDTAEGVEAVDAEAKNTIAWQDPDGAKLSYGKLFAYDSTGNRLDANMARNTDGIQIAVDDRNAVYPVVIDPFFQAQKLEASDGIANAHVGTSVSISGDWAVVGAPNASGGGFFSAGAAYVYQRQGPQNWVEVDKLEPGGVFNFSDFGYSVSIDDDRLIVGAPGENSDEGKAYIYERDPMDVWNLADVVESIGVQVDDRFGSSVSISGDNAIAGAPFDDVVLPGPVLNVDQGAAFIFKRQGPGNWDEVDAIISSDGAANDLFGSSVSMDGDQVVVGAPNHQIFASDVGEAYVFQNDGADNWMEEQILFPSDGLMGGGHRFGTSVSIHGERIIVGAPNTDVGVDAEQGAAYISEDDGGGTWPEVAILTPVAGAAGDHFGTGVAIYGDWAIGGAPDANGSQGSVTLFMRDMDGNWLEDQTLGASDGAADDMFGYSVDITEDRFITGAPNDHIGANDDEGSAYVFERTGLLFVVKDIFPFKEDLIEFLGTGFPVTCPMDGTFFLGHNQFAWCDLFEGTYTVDEFLPPDYSLVDIDCMVETDSTFNTSGTLLSVDLVPDDFVVCTYFNRSLQITNKADLSVTKEVLTPQPGVGTPMTYRVSVANLGPDEALGVGVTDVLPASVDFVSAVSTHDGVCSEIVESVVRCNIDSIPNGETAVIDIIVNPVAGGLATNNVSVNSASIDQFLANNDDVVVTDILGSAIPLLQVTTSSFSVNAEPGQLVTIPVMVANQTSAAVANNVIFNVDLPPGFVLDGLQTEQGTCNNTLEQCQLGNIVPGQVVTIFVHTFVPTEDGTYIIGYSASAGGQTFNNNSTVTVGQGGGGGGGGGSGDNNDGSCAIAGSGSPGFAPMLVWLVIPAIVLFRRMRQR